MRVLGIESSCDELAMAVLEADGRTLRANVIHSQVELHQRFGGVVPEIAARDHVRRLNAVFRATMTEAALDPERLDGIAVTAGPGLIGPLLCGVQFAKGLALALGRPIVGVHHLEGHIAAVYLEENAPRPPFVTLLVSGGHTMLFEVTALGAPVRILGRTRDDAAGEAFDKTAKLLGLGYPGGIAIDRLSEGGDLKRVPFPTLMPGRDNLDFSFSGLKTAAARLLRERGAPPEGQELRDFCASFQSTVVENLLKKAFRATVLAGHPRLVIAGGVAANRHLRARAAARGSRAGVDVYLPSRAFCTDNAAMIACAGQRRLQAGEDDDLDFDARPHWPLPEARA